eukprot:SAG11_NODE_1074_length_5968_cov_2.041063_4_plen_117_part_00
MQRHVATNVGLRAHSRGVQRTARRARYWSSRTGAVVFGFKHNFDSNCACVSLGPQGSRGVSDRSAAWVLCRLGRSAFWHAAKARYWPVAQLLLDVGADPELRGEHSPTAGSSSIPP